MAFTLSTGSTVSIAKTYAAPLNFSAATNDEDCTLTVSGSTIVAGDLIEVSSGWSLLDKRVVRAGTGTSATAIVLDGVDTTNTNRFPPGAGVGSVRKITAWSQITQLRTVTSAGSDQQFADITTMVDYEQRQLPTTRSPVTVTLEVFDDPNLTWIPDVKKADESRTPYGFRILAANGNLILANAYWSMRTVPNIQQNEALTTTIDLSFAAAPNRYAAT